MSERLQGQVMPSGSTLSGAELLALAVEVLLAEDPVDLPAPQALERLRGVLRDAERLHAAQLAAISDLDRRELYALDCAGSARGWLRRQPGGEQGQVTLARRLAQRPEVAAAHAAARIARRSAEQLCTALEAVPDTVDDALLQAVVVDGIGRLLCEHTGGTPDTDDDAAREAVLARRAADLDLLAACCADVAATPAARLEPAFVLLAERLPATELGPALRLLLDPLQPDGTDPGSPPADPYYLELRTLLDGDVDVRGHLDAETGQALAAEIDRRLQQARSASRAPVAEGAANTSTQDTSVQAPNSQDPDVQYPDDPLAAWADAPARAVQRAEARTATGAADLGHADRGPDAPVRLVTTGRRRHDALRDLLHDAADAGPSADAGPRPAHLTILATLDAVAGRLGALPAQLELSGRHPAPLATTTLQRLGCFSDLDAVLLDAAGNAVGASSTRRMPNRRERRALRARWGPTCAVDACPRTRTVPHHVEPWWLSASTRLRDLVPLCEHCHHDVHEGHRTLRLRDGRLLDDRGWTSAPRGVAAA